MQSILKYFFPRKPEPSIETEDVAIYIPHGESIQIIRLSNILNITDRATLIELGQRVYTYIVETVDEEECANASILLEEIEKKLSAQ
jgi:ABC-type uncharacterized transport system ATPase subunit